MMSVLHLGGVKGTVLMAGEPRHRSPESVFMGEQNPICERSGAAYGAGSGTEIAPPPADL